MRGNEPETAKKAFCFTKIPDKILNQNIVNYVQFILRDIGDNVDIFT